MSLGWVETQTPRDRCRKASLVKCEGGCGAEFIARGGKKRCIPCAETVRAAAEAARYKRRYLRRKANSPERASVIVAESHT